MATRQPTTVLPTLVAELVSLALRGWWHLQNLCGFSTPSAMGQSFIQGDSSFTAGGKIDLKNYNFVFIFCRPNLLFIRHIISKNEIYKLIRSNFGIFSIISCLSYSTLWHMHTQVFSLVISRVHVKLSIICSSARSPNLTCTRGYFSRLFPGKNLHDK
jgi:hypothetical protein